MKPYQVKKEFRGTTFTAQFNGLSAALKMQDSIDRDGTNITSNEKLANYIFENVIVDPPHLTPDSELFTSMRELNEVIAWATGVATGNFSEKTDEAGAEKPGK